MQKWFENNQNKEATMKFKNMKGEKKWREHEKEKIEIQEYEENLIKQQIYNTKKTYNKLLKQNTKRDKHWMKQDARTFFLNLKMLEAKEM